MCADTSTSSFLIAFFGIIDNPRFLSSLSAASGRISVHIPNIKFESRSVHKKMPVNILPSIISIRKFLFSHPFNFVLPSEI